VDANGQKQQEAEFHNIVVWGKMAELCSQYLAKGRMVFIEGRIRTHSWQDADNQKRYKTEIIAENIQFGPRFTSQTELKVPAAEGEVEESPQDLPILEETKENPEEENLEEIPF